MRQQLPWRSGARRPDAKRPGAEGGQLYVEVFFEQESSQQGEELEAAQRPEENREIAERNDGRRVSAARSFCAAGARPFSAVGQINGIRVLHQAECLVQKQEPTRASQIAIIGHLEFPPFIVKPAEF